MIVPSRAEVVEVLVDHLMAIQHRDNTQKTELTWPDHSDVYTATYRRLCVLFEVDAEETP